MFVRKSANWIVPGIIACCVASTFRTSAEEPRLPALPQLPALPSPHATAAPAPAQVAAGDASSQTETVQLARLLKLAEDSSKFQPMPLDARFSAWQVLDGKLDSWVVNGNTVSCLRTGGGWLCTRELYSDFICRFEYRLTAGANSGVAFRCQTTGNPSFTGFEVQLLDDSAAKYAGLRPEQHTGSLYYRRAPDRKASVKPAGEWNTAEIICFADSIRVSINGEVVNSVGLKNLPASVVHAAGTTNPAVKPTRPQAGPIALQSYSSRIDFRNLRIYDFSERSVEGVRLVDLVEGSGASATAQSTVKLHYTGQLVDGSQFTNSYQASEPVVVSLEDAISGWQAGITGMKVGGRRRLIIPPELAYGEEGIEPLIPARATLVFDLELLGVEE